jgi:hypothetical protein
MAEQFDEGRFGRLLVNPVRVWLGTYSIFGDSTVRLDHLT